MKKFIGKQGLSALMGASFNRQRNSDAFGCSDIGGHFKNRYASNICFAEGDEGEGGGNEAPVSFPNQAALDDYIAKLAKPADKPADKPIENNGESVTEKRDRERRELETKTAEQGVFKNAVLFETQFDGVMKEAAKFLTNPDSVKTIRTDVKEEDTIKRAGIMAATAAKEFFNNPKNVGILEKSDQDLVTASILGVRYESDIDGMKAWELMRRAIYNHNLKDKHDKMRDVSGSGTGQYGYEKLDASLKAFYPDSVVAL